MFPLDHITHFSYIGQRGAMEDTLISEAHIPFYAIRAGKLRRYLSIRNLFDIFNIGIGILQSLWILFRLHPDVIFSKGGYVAFPVVLAGKVLCIPIIIHESDVRPGLTTKLCSRFATTICLSWENSKKFFTDQRKLVVTGVPVRHELLEGDRKKGRALFDLKNALPLLLVVGGSQGAQALNEAVSASLPELLKHWNVVHVVGQQNNPTSPAYQGGGIQGIYTQIAFLKDEIADVFAATDVVLSRAGGTALAEFELVHLPCILIPLPLTQSRGDQIENAEEYAKKYPDSVRVIPQEKLTSAVLMKNLEELGSHKIATEKNISSRPATDSILELLMKK